MPNRRAADGQKTNFNQTPRGIIRVAALCPSSCNAVRYQSMPA